MTSNGLSDQCQSKEKGVGMATGGACRYGVVRPLWHWIFYLAGGPLIVGAVSGVVASCVGACLSMIFLLIGTDDRLQGTVWFLTRADAEGVFYACFLVTFAVVAASLTSRWARRAYTQLWVDGEKLVCWSLAGRTTLAWGEVVRGFITSNGEGRTLHLWTPWRDLALSMDRIAEVPSVVSDDPCEAFISDVRGHLLKRGLSLEEGVPSSRVTDRTWPLLSLIFWPHRRLLAHQLKRQLECQDPWDHRSARTLPRLTWAFRPAPVLTCALAVAVLVVVRMLTSAQWVTQSLAGGGAFLILLIPACRGLLEWVRRRRVGLRPVDLVGRFEVPEPLPDVFFPAPGCKVDLAKGQVVRSDRSFAFDEIKTVEYGPALRRDKKSVSHQAWHLAVEVDRGGQEYEEIFHNASVDIVRHGDVDAGYAVFNWAMARAIAQGAQSDLVLAHGRTPRHLLGRPLVEILSADASTYDPEALCEAPHAQVRVRSDGALFEAWGPLMRMPESLAAAPLVKAALALGSLALIPTGFWPAGFLAGCFIMATVHDVLAMREFSHAGFTMDGRGVWVRGRCIEWGDLEQSTLMPVAPGPILFAGRSKVLVVGHLGGTYRDRAWLGCSAYHWIQRHHCDKV